MSTKRVLITAGGTGGHIYPAQGLAQQLTKHPHAPSVLFVAGGLKSNKYFDRSLFAFKEVATSPLAIRHPLKALKGIFNLGKGVVQSMQIIREFQPHVVVGFGSYYTVPTLLAAKLLGVPIILHEANSIPGKANKWLAPLAWRIGVHFPSTTSLLKGNVVEVGMPLREGYHLDQVDRTEAFSYFQLDPLLPTLLVFGGSQGARAINQLMLGASEKLKTPSFQVIHLTGDLQVVEQFKSHYKSLDIKACVKPFENKMHLAWKLADLFLGRAGASTIAEAMEFEVPGILIPYPHATDQHQEKNADFFVRTVGGGVVFLEKQLTSDKLAEVIFQESLSVKREERKKSIQAYKHTPNRLTLCDLVLKTCF